MSTETMDEGDRVWLMDLDQKTHQPKRWRQVEIIRASSLPLVETQDGKRFQVFWSSLHWQPNKLTDLPVEAP